MTLCSLCARPFTRHNPLARYCTKRCQIRAMNARRNPRGYPAWRTLLHEARAESWALRAIYRAHGHIRCAPRRRWDDVA